MNKIIDLFKVCITQNYFCFENKFYIQKEALLMGNPMSTLLAHIFTGNLENKSFLSSRSKLCVRKNIF